MTGPPIDTDPARAPAAFVRRVPARSSARREHDRGYSLVEVLITAVLMGTVVVGVLAAVSASIAASSASKVVARAESALTAGAARIDAAPHSCDDLTAAVTAAAVGAFKSADPPTITLTQEHYSTVGGVTEWVAGTCPVAATSSAGVVQRFTITLTAPDSATTRKLEVVK